MGKCADIVFCSETTTLFTHINQPANFVFVTLTSQAHAQRAIRELNGRHYHGSKITVQVAHRNQQNRAPTQQQQTSSVAPRWNAPPINVPGIITIPTRLHPSVLRAPAAQHPPSFPAQCTLPRGPPAVNLPAFLPPTTHPPTFHPGAAWPRPQQVPGGQRSPYMGYHHTPNTRPQDRHRPWRNENNQGQNVASHGASSTNVRTEVVLPQVRYADLAKEPYSSRNTQKQGREKQASRGN